VVDNIFLKPRFVGKRFKNHSLPLEILKDLAVLEELITEVAKREYIKKNPNKSRVPNGFTRDITFKLTGIEEGSAIPAIEIEPAENSLFPVYYPFFEMARESIANGIDAADKNENIIQFLDESVLTYFDRIGRGLKDGEIIEFPTPKRENPSRLTRESRKRLVMASSKIEITDDIIIRGYIPELDQNKMTFEIKTIDNESLQANIPEQHFDTLMEAFNGYKKKTKILLVGVGLFNKKQKMTGIESIGHISILDLLDIPSRLVELKNLKNGWLDGHGKAPGAESLNWLSEFMENSYPEDLTLPYLFPTESGGIRAEWESSEYDQSLDIDLETHQCRWHSLNLLTDSEEDKTFSIDESTDWDWIISNLRNRSGVTTVE
jgi:hypothetical protein